MAKTDIEAKEGIWRWYHNVSECYYQFWTDGYYIATISGKGNKRVIEQYIKNQGREKDIEQLRLFTAD